MLLELKNIKKHYALKSGFGQPKGVVRAVDDVSLIIKGGENLGIVGESGSGKTTLARVIMRLITPDAGQILFNQQKIMRKDLKDFRRNVQMVFQDPYSSLDPRYTIRNVIKEGFALDAGKYKTEEAKELRI